MILLFLLFVCAIAEWPPRDCDPGARINGQSIILTSSVASDRQDNSCSLNEPFKSIVYIQASRKYGPRSDQVGDSKLTVSIGDLFDVEIHNDKILLGKTTNQCFFPMVSTSPETFWLRLRLHSMMDIHKTFVSLSLIPFDGESFVDCAKMELQGFVDSFTVALRATTETGMEQIVHSISKHREGKKSIDDDSIMEARLNRLEERLRRLQSVVTEYIGAHEQLSQSINDNHMSLKSSIVATQNKIKTASTTSSMFGGFLFVLIFICGIFYIKWRSNEDNRFHMP